MTSDACPQRFPKTENLGHQLRTAGFSFAGYAESLPKVGFTGCASGRYERKHNPWVDFTNLPASVNRPFSSFPDATIANCRPCRLSARTCATACTTAPSELVTAG